MTRRSLIAGLALGAALAAGAATAQDDPVQIVPIPKNTGNPYFDSLVADFEDAWAEIGCGLSQAAPATAEATSQIPFVTAQIRRGVDAIALSPDSPDALIQVLDRARERGILVLAADGDLVGDEQHRDAAVLPVDFAKTGPGRVELLGSMIACQGEIAILSATTDAPDQNTWIAAMKDTLETDPRCEGMEPVATVYGDDEPQRSPTEAEALLQAHPDLRGIIPPTTVGVAAAAQVPQSAEGPGGQADGPRHAGPDAALRRGRHGGGVPALEPLRRGLARGPLRRGRDRRHDRERGRRHLRGARSGHDHDLRGQRDRHPGRADHLRRREHRRPRLLRMEPPARAAGRGPRRTTRSEQA